LEKRKVSKRKSIVRDGACFEKGGAYSRGLVYNFPKQAKMDQAH
jgi:hypothetical protein